MSNPFGEDPYPDVRELEQFDTDEPTPLDIKPIPTVVEELRDMVRAMLVPFRDVSMQSVRITAGSTARTAVKLCSKESRRGRITLMFQCATGGSNTIVYVGSKEEVEQGTAAQWPAKVPGGSAAPPLVLSHVDEMWAAIDVADTNTITVSVISELWAD